MRTAVVREKIQRLVRASPFRPFALNLENGDRIIVEHPENIAFHPGMNGSQGSEDFHVISNGLWSYGTFEAVTTVALLDQGQLESQG